LSGDFKFLVQPTTISVAPAATVAEANNFSALTVGVSGLQDGSSEVFQFGSTSIPLTGTATSGTVSVDSMTWNWSLSGSNLSFTPANGSVVASELQSFVHQIVYNDTASSPTPGTRIFAISATDTTGHTSTVANAVIDTQPPSITGLPAAGSGLSLTRNVAVSLEPDPTNHAISFVNTGAYSSSETLTLALNAFNGTISGLPGETGSQSSFTLTGTASQLSTNFKTAQFTAAASGVPDLVLTLNDSTGNHAFSHYNFATLG
jgi:hypothetical protein